jgi:hypothetical protein
LKLKSADSTFFGSLRQLVFGESPADPTDGNAWVVEDGTGAGRVIDQNSAAILAALNGIGIAGLPDNRCTPATVDLTLGAAALPLGLAGRHLNVLGLTGNAQIQLVNAGGTYALTDIYPTDLIEFDFTDVLLTCLPQPGKTLSLLASWRA